MLIKLFIATMTVTTYNAVTTLTVTDYPDRTSCERDASDLTATTETDIKGLRVIVRTTARCREVLVRDGGVPEPMPEMLPIPDPRFFQPRPGCLRPGQPGCYAK